MIHIKYISMPSLSCCFRTFQNTTAKPWTGCQHTCFTEASFKLNTFLYTEKYHHNIIIYIRLFISLYISMYAISSPLLFPLQPILAHFSFILYYDTLYSAFHPCLVSTLYIPFLLMHCSETLHLISPMIGFDTLHLISIYAALFLHFKFHSHSCLVLTLYVSFAHFISFSFTCMPVLTIYISLPPMPCLTHYISFPPTPCSYTLRLIFTHAWF